MKKGIAKLLVTQLAQVQSLGARLITKAFKATSTQVLNIQTYLTPIGLVIDKKVHQTAARLHSGSLYSIITEGRSTQPRQTPTPLEVLEKRRTKLLGSSIQELERTPVCIVAPWWQPPNLDIASSKKAVIHLHNQIVAQKTARDTLAYTDGSRVNKNRFRMHHFRSASTYKKLLGTDKTSTVYMGEMQGILD